MGHATNSWPQAMDPKSRQDLYATLYALDGVTEVLGWVKLGNPPKKYLEQFSWDWLKVNFRETMVFTCFYIFLTTKYVSFPLKQSN